jgi:hypothetical protein
MRYANAVVVKPEVSDRGWGNVRKAAMNPSKNLVAQASEILGEQFDPSRYLLTHCTIVASVDVDSVPNVRLGKIKIGNSGKTINRKYSNYLIQSQCSQFVNNNGDSWSRDVLMASYRTFIGGHNFLEHVQIEEMSKGRIIDAVARDIGDSVYIDILVATDRKHTSLVADIKSGKLATLSMGCSVEETICTKCGNVAVDETELCDCIRYSKMNTFMDDRGQKRVIAELCGHPDLGDTCGVTFIEASWVATPAFTGAVLRNILEPTAMPPEFARRIQAILQELPPQWSGTNIQKVASLQAAAFDFADPEEEGEKPAAEPEEKASPINETVDVVYDEVTKRVKKKVQEDIAEDDRAEALSPEEGSDWQNDSVDKWGGKTAAQVRSAAYSKSAYALTRTAKSDADFVNKLATLNQAFDIHVAVDLYRASLQVGPADAYSSMKHFLTACHHAVGRPTTPADIRVMARIGKLLCVVAEELRSPPGDLHV